MDLIYSPIGGYLLLCIVIGAFVTLSEFLNFLGKGEPYIPTLKVSNEQHKRIQKILDQYYSLSKPEKKRRIIITHTRGGRK